MSDQQQNPMVGPFIDHVAAVIWDAQRQPFSAPIHVAGALYEAGLLDLGGWIERQVSGASRDQH